MEKFDLAVLGYFQGISDRVQEITAITNFFLARLCWIVMLVTELFNSLNNWRDNGFSVWLVIGLVLYALITLIILFLINKGEQVCQTNPTFSNINQAGLSGMREFALGFCIVSLILNIPELLAFFAKDGHEFLKEFSRNLNILAYLSCLYFASCTPKPPSKSKVRKLIERLGEALSPSPALSKV